MKPIDRPLWETNIQLVNEIFEQPEWGNNYFLTMSPSRKGGGVKLILYRFDTEKFTTIYCFDYTSVVDDTMIMLHRLLAKEENVRLLNKFYKYLYIAKTREVT